MDTHFPFQVGQATDDDLEDFALMPISAWHLWHHSVHELQINHLGAMAAETLMGLPLVQRRRRLALSKLHGLERPRHLYKFRSVPATTDKNGRERLAQLIVDNELYAATSDTFNDPFDAQADYRVLERGQELRDAVYRFLRERGADEEIARGLSQDDSLNSPERTAALMQENHRATLRQLGVYCLAATARDPLLWAHYAQDHHGIAVQFRPSLDLKALLIHRVEYNNTYPVIDNYFNARGRDLVSPLLRKSKSWEYENEWRVIRDGQPNRVFSIRPEAITGVLLGLRISDEGRDYIEELVHDRDRRHGVKTRMYKAEQSPGKYAVRFKRFR